MLWPHQFGAIRMQLIPLGAPALLGLFREVLDSSLVERGAAEGMELLGHADAFWPQVGLPELRRMAQGGNPSAQAELAWRSAVGEGLAKSATEAVQWATQSAEKQCPAGEAVLGWLDAPEKCAALAAEFRSLHETLRCNAGERIAEALEPYLA